MKKSFLFNISEQEGLPGGPNEVNNNLLGSLSVSQNVYIPQYEHGGLHPKDDGERTYETYDPEEHIINIKIFMK
jgi:hypothetical protein